MTKIDEIKLKILILKKRDVDYVVKRKKNRLLRAK